MRVRWQGSFPAEVGIHFSMGEGLSCGEVDTPPSRGMTRGNVCFGSPWLFLRKGRCAAPTRAARPHGGRVPHPLGRRFFSAEERARCTNFLDICS